MRAVLLTAFQAPARLPREFGRLLDGIDDQRSAAAELTELCRPSSRDAVIACTDAAGDFSR